MCGEPVDLHIIRDVQEHLVDGVDYDIFRGDVFKINLIDAGAVLHVECHPGRGDDEVNRKLRICLQLGEKIRRAGQPVPRSEVLSSCVSLADALPDLKQPCSSGDSVAFEGRRDGKTDGLIRPALVCHNKVGIQGIEAALPAFHGGIEGFQVDCDVGSVFHPGLLS